MDMCVYNTASPKNWHAVASVNRSRRDIFWADPKEGSSATPTNLWGAVGPRPPRPGVLDTGPDHFFSGTPPPHTPPQRDEARFSHAGVMYMAGWLGDAD